MINIEKMIALDEGKRLKVYKCTQGFKTVGIGHNLDADPALGILHRHLNLGELITEEECSLLFRHDLDNVYAGIKKKMPFFDTLQEKYKPVIINMVFQMGINGVLAFKNTLNDMQRDRPTLVEQGIKNSKYAKQTPERANRMVKLVLGKPVPEYR